MKSKFIHFLSCKLLKRFFRRNIIAILFSRSYVADYCHGFQRRKQPVTSAPSHGGSLLLVLLLLLLSLQNLYSAQIQACSSRRRWCRWVGKWTSPGMVNLKMAKPVAKFTRKINIHYSVTAYTQNNSFLMNAENTLEYICHVLFLTFHV